MSTTYTERTILLTSNTGNFDVSGVLADTGVQGATSLAVASAIRLEFPAYQTLSGGVYTQVSGMSLIWFLTSTNDATVLAGVAAFALRWPQYGVFTWSRTVVYG